MSKPDLLKENKFLPFQLISIIYDYFTPKKLMNEELQKENVELLKEGDYALIKVKEGMFKGIVIKKEDDSVTLHFEQNQQFDGVFFIHEGLVFPASPHNMKIFTKQDNDHERQNTEQHLVTLHLGEKKKRI